MSVSKSTTPRTRRSSRRPLPPAGSEFIEESRDHFYRAGMEFLLALRTFGEGWLARMDISTERPDSWTDSLRTILNEIAHLTETYAKGGPDIRQGNALQELIEVLDAELDAITPPMDEHKRAYRDALLGVKRVLARRGVSHRSPESAKTSSTVARTGFRPVRID
ncbi:MAG: hypothetical protein HYT87_07295 [Nitrospirae bacterium]|nr:hypothetical protein [Nitrospirota bacterium]